VLSLVDGEKSVVELCHESERARADPEGPLRLPLHRHRPRPRAEGPGARPGLRAEDSALAVLDSFNRMYRHVLAYMV